MKLLKPEWVHHDEKPIFSIDVHPDGTKFATGGQGADSGRVVIWNLLPVISEEAEQSKNVVKKLCQLDNHLACVNSVRWSTNGLTLASGGDDKIIMLWMRGKGPTAVFGNTGITKTAENWRCTTTLRGHSGDVLDLAWSPNDRWLASSSVDNNVIVWDMHNLPSMVAILKGHTGLVKGVTWDPVGKYLASQSDDRSVKIWRTNDWMCESTITEPFEECGGTTHVLRLSWSPDGLYLVSAHAMNGGGPTAQIIEREGWKCDKDFVGHRKAVTCVRFHQSILKRQTPDKKKSQQYCCLAVGSRDKSLSVWMTALQRPLVVVYDLFKDSILDLSWSTDKNILLACSTDGTVACVMFTEIELGTSLSQDDKNSLYQRMYGKSAEVDMNDSNVDKGMLVEYAELLDVSDNKGTPEKKQSANNNINNNNTNNNSTRTDADIEMSSNSKPPLSSSPFQTSTPTKAIHKQIETRTADGKRRITPMFIPLQEQDVDANAETGTLAASSRSISSSVFEKKMDEQMNRGQVLIEASTSKPDLFESNVQATTSAPTLNQNTAQLDSRLTKGAPMKSADVSILPDENKQSADIKLTAASPQIPIQLNTVNAGKAVPFTTVAVKKFGDIKVDILNNNVNTAHGPLCKVVCTMPSNQWETYIGSPVVNFVLCAKYALICSLDGTLRFYDIKMGTSVMPILKMFTPAVQCVFSINCELAGVITECSSIRIWNLRERKIFISLSCCDLLNNAGTTLFVSYFHVSEGGIVFVLLSNGYSYSYSKDLDSWILLNSRDPIIRHGISNLPSNSTKSIKTYPLGTVQSASQILQSHNRNVADISNNSWQNAAKLSFIENQIQICTEINSPIELENWYSILGLHLAQHGTEKRLRILLDDLLGSSVSCFSNTKVSDCILGIEKHKILTKVLDHLKTVPKWQRIYIEYAEQLRDLIRNKLNASLRMEAD